MKKVFLISSLALLGQLSACGGGGENAGDASEFSVTPSEWTWTYSNESCSSSVQESIVVIINGGQAPFKIVSSIPSRLQVDRSEASGKDPSFRVTHLGGCVDTATISVVDYHSKLVTMEFTAEYEEPSQ